MQVQRPFHGTTFFINVLQLSALLTCDEDESEVHGDASMGHGPCILTVCIYRSEAQVQLCLVQPNMREAPQM